MSEPEKKPVKDLSARFKDARLEVDLWRHIFETEKWIAGMHDPELGAIGPLFRKEMSKSKSRENVDLKIKANAVFNSFVWPPRENQRSFQNGISYGALALENKGRLLGARVHEFIHAMQYRKAACLHTDPFNDASAVILSPLNYVRRKELLEQDAYAKGAWLQSLAVNAHPAIATALDLAPVTVSEFEKIRANAPNLKAALADAALHAAEKQGTWIDKDKTCAARDLWHKQALAEYAGIIKARREAGLPLQFARLEPRDIVEVGNSFGPNAFEGDNRFNTMPKLSAENRQLLDDLNRECGLTFIAGHDTVGDAIEKRGETRASFIARSYKNRGRG